MTAFYEVATPGKRCASAGAAAWKMKLLIGLGIAVVTIGIGIGVGLARPEDRVRRDVGIRQRYASGQSGETGTAMPPQVVEPRV
ncbi:MAG: hypothetical protein R3C45_11670 [Phycisphaerales bacterium]